MSTRPQDLRHAARRLSRRAGSAVVAGVLAAAAGLAVTALSVDVMAAGVADARPERSLYGAQGDRGTGSRGEEGRLEYIAHSAFLIRSPGGTELLIDPYASGVWLGYRFPSGLQPDAILITHPHYDHDGGRFLGREVWWEEGMRIIDAPGRYEVGDVTVHGTRGKHADPYGKEFGQRNTIMVVEVAGIRLAHVGDNGPLTPENVREMGAIDILLLPIDGQEHILSNEAIEQAIAAVQPRILIPMHYRIPELEASPESPRGLGEIDPWLEGRYNIERRDSNQLALAPDALPVTPPYRLTILVLRHSAAVRRLDP